MRKTVAGIWAGAFLLVCVVAAGGCGNIPAGPGAVQGCLDLSDRDFREQGPAALEGEWAFYWNRLLEPEDAGPKDPGPEDAGPETRGKTSGFIRLPGLWQGRTVNGVALPAKGVATYRLTVKVNPGSSPNALFIQNVLAVCKVWVNGRPAAQSGSVGRDRKTEKPVKHALAFPFHATGDTLDILIQVSNHHNAQGGINSPVWLGRHEDINGMITKSRVTIAALAGAVLIMGLFHLVLYRTRDTEPANLLFGAFCVIWAVQNFFGISGGFMMAELFGGLPWRLSIDASLIPFAFTPPLMVMFYHALFPAPGATVVNRIFQTSGVLFLVYLLLTPPNAYDPVIRHFHLMSVAAALYLLFRFAADLARKREGVFLLIPGYVILILSIANDLLYDLHLINTPAFFPLGMFVFILSYSFLIAVRFSRAFDAVERLTGQLRERNLRLSRMDRLKDEFLANTSHELRTPLNGIIGMAESLRDRPLPAVAESGLTTIISSGRRLAALINDLLDYSRLRNRDIALDMKAVALKTLADAVITVSAPLLSGRPVHLVNRIPEDFPLVEADENRLQQIFFNLIGNAVKFTEKGRIIVDAREEAGMAVITVSDTGIGIPRDRREEIFRSFEQVDKGPSRRYGGTGLGLAITRDLVGLHKGVIGVDSQEGAGSEFRFTLPLSREFRPSLPDPGRGIPIQGAVPQASPGPVPSGKTCDKSAVRILAVDDDPVNLQVLDGILGARGMAVPTAISGRAALAVLEAGDLPDLVLLDVMMPGMTGFEVCEALRKTHSQSELPVIMLTARNRVSDLVAGLETGANDYLAKPFSKDELLARIDTQLRLKQAYRTFKENSRLKQELALREKTEQELKIRQRKLSGILDTVSDAVAAVNGVNEISFANQAFESLTGLAIPDLLGAPVSTLFPGEPDPAGEKLLADLAGGCIAPGESGHYPGLTLRHARDKVLHTHVLLTRLELAEEYFHLLILKTDGLAGIPSGAVDRVMALDRDSRRLASLENALNRISRKGGQQENPDLAAIDSLLEKLDQDGTAPGQETRLQLRRRLAVRVMNLALDYWAVATGATKIELADRSGLWNVYIGKDGWARTQTLDRYLKEETLPQKPRWKQIRNTADFVLATTTQPNDLRDRLEAELAQFRKTL